MTASGYKKMASRFFRSKKSVVALRMSNLILTAIVYIAYPSLMLYLLIVRDVHFQRALLVPGCMFVFVSGLRKVLDRPRPYDVFAIKPLLVKEKRGESMPSRHIFSVFVIAMTFLYVFGFWAALPFFVIGVLMAVIRVVGGVHFLSDVLVGAAIGIISGIIGFFII